HVPGLNGEEDGFRDSHSCQLVLGCRRAVIIDLDAVQKRRRRSPRAHGGEIVAEIFKGPPHSGPGLRQRLLDWVSGHWNLLDSKRASSASFLVAWQNVRAAPAAT